MTNTQTPSEFLNKKKEMRDFIFKKFATNWNEQLMKNDFSKYNILEQQKRRLEIGEKVTRQYNSELLIFIKSLRESRKEFQLEINKMRYPDYTSTHSSLNTPGIQEMTNALLFVSNLTKNWSDFVRSAYDMGRITFSLQVVELLLSNPNHYTDDLKVYDTAKKLKEEFENHLNITEKVEMVSGLEALIISSEQFIRDVNDIPEFITWDAFNSTELETLHNSHPGLYEQLRSDKYNQKAFAKQREV